MISTSDKLTKARACVERPGQPSANANVYVRQRAHRDEQTVEFSVYPLIRYIVERRMRNIIGGAEGTEYEKRSN